MCIICECIIVKQKGLFRYYNIIHEVFSHTILVSNGHESVHIFGILHTKLGEILDIDSNVSPLSDLQPTVDILAEEVPHLLIVQLKVGNSYKKSRNHKTAML